MIATDDLQVLICRRFLGATGVANAGSEDTRQRSEERISRPEAAHAEGGAFALDLLQLARHPAEGTDIVTLEDRARGIRVALVRRNGAIVRENRPDQAG